MDPDKGTVTKPLSVEAHLPDGTEDPPDNTVVFIFKRGDVAITAFGMSLS